MTKFFGAAIATSFLCTLLLGSAAYAQQVGEYDGQTADGQGVQFIVGIDPDTGLYELTGTTIFYSAPCYGAGAGYTLNTGWGFGLATDVSHRRANIIADDPFFHIEAKLFFPDANTITGTIDTRSPMLVPMNPRPHQAAFCWSPTQSVSLTFSGSSSKMSPLASGEAVRHPVKITRQ